MADLLEQSVCITFGHSTRLLKRMFTAWTPYADEYNTYAVRHEDAVPVLWARRGLLGPEAIYVLDPELGWSGVRQGSCDLQYKLVGTMGHYSVSCCPVRGDCAPLERAPA